MRYQEAVNAAMHAFLRHEIDACNPHVVISGMREHAFFQGVSPNPVAKACHLHGVKRRVTKRWSIRACRTMLPRSGRLTGPRPHGRRVPKRGVIRPPMTAVQTWIPGLRKTTPFTRVRCEHRERPQFMGGAEGPPCGWEGRMLDTIPCEDGGRCPRCGSSKFYLATSPAPPSGPS